MVVESRRRQVITVIFSLAVFTWMKLSILQNYTNEHHNFSIKYPGSNSSNKSNFEYQNSYRNFVAKSYFNQTLNNTPGGVILFVKGGIGNQLFEYACSYALARDTNRTLYNFITNTTITSDRGFKSNQRYFALDQFQIPLDNFIDKTTVINLSQVSYVNDEQLLWRNFTDKPFIQLLPRAYCQSEKYWRKYRSDLKVMFKPKPETINYEKIQHYLDMIENTESVVVHVRRGDFLLVTGFFIPTSYHRRAIRRISKILNKRSGSPPTFFIFSDDGEYVRRKFQDLAVSDNFVYVSDGNHTSIEDFYLMMRAKHFIIPNSTFSWWAAYLSESSKRKIVIATAFNPQFWQLWKNDTREMEFYKMLHGKMYHPKEWIVIDPFTGGY